MDTDLKDTQLVYGIVAKIKYQPILQIQATLPDKGGILSPWASVLSARSMVGKHYDPPIKGEMVALLLTDQGESALCLGTVFSEADSSPAGDHRFIKRFDDNTQIEYDSKEHLLTIDAVGDISVICKNASLTADKVTVTAPKTIIDGETEITGDCKIGGISFLEHYHGGVMGGKSKTLPPS